ncbi:thiamine pyrophosphate-dependent enzyme [Streptomyces sp. NPDC002896]|uniref:thiamine pyrophosphate-dependent enzyme n=1 Tax=Streptomyces sp. NPDC002896 TaxID=3154438 RepID=UPI00331CA27E
MSPRLISEFKPNLLQSSEHDLCPGCGHGIAWRAVLDVVAELGLKPILLAGHGCYTQLMINSDLDSLQCLHGRAPAAATGIKRMLPQTPVITLQGDGDMVSEGLHEVLHAASRGEKITSLLFNNGVFGDTGGHMTATTVVGQRTKTSLDGRDPDEHGHPIDIGRLLAQIDGAAYVARGAVNSPAMVARTKHMVRRALELQVQGAGFTFVEVLTMCPTGWFVSTPEGPGYLKEAMMENFGIGELKAPAES